MRTLIVLAVASIVAFAADNSLGTWKLNIEKSTYTPAPMPFKSVTIVREAFADGVRVTTTVGRADGSQINFTYNEIHDDEEHPVPGAGSPFDTISTNQIDANTFTDKRRKIGGSFESAVRTVISLDGKTMTTTAKGINAEGKPFSDTLVFDKQ